MITIFIYNNIIQIDEEVRNQSTALQRRGNRQARQSQQKAFLMDFQSRCQEPFHDSRLLLHFWKGETHRRSPDSPRERNACRCFFSASFHS